MLRRFPILALGLALASAPLFPETITVRDVREMTAKVSAAQRIFESTWSRIFNGSGQRSPRLVAYYDPIVTPCGVMHRGNAGYCSESNTIYYDAVFLTHLMKRAGQRLGTDGDYAPVLALAHEWGHAVAVAMGIQYRTAILNEATADCLAGAATRSLDDAGYLDPGDLDEARFTLAILGDHPGVRLTQEGAHGSAATRLEQFTRGYQEGVAACSRRLVLADAAPGFDSRARMP